MENIMKLITIRSGYFALFVFFCLIIFIICICIIGRIQMIKRKNYKVYYPAEKYQINHFAFSSFPTYYFLSLDSYFHFAKEFYQDHNYSNYNKYYCEFRTVIFPKINYIIFHCKPNTNKEHYKTNNTYLP